MLYIRQLFKTYAYRHRPSTSIRLRRGPWNRRFRILIGWASGRWTCSSGLRLGRSIGRRPGRIWTNLWALVGCRADGLETGLSVWQCPARGRESRGARTNTTFARFDRFRDSWSQTCEYNQISTTWVGIGIKMKNITVLFVCIILSKYLVVIFKRQSV